MKKILAKVFLYLVTAFLGLSMGAPGYIAFFGSVIYVQLVFLEIAGKENGP